MSGIIQYICFRDGTMSIRFIRVVPRVRISFRFKAELHGLDGLHLVYPFVCQQALGLLQPLGYCEECSCEHEHAEMTILELGRLSACLLH